MNNKTTKETILEKIQTGEVQMRPRWQFVLQAVLTLSGVVLISLGLLYLLSFILFILRETGVFFIPVFGVRGMMTFLWSSPWVLVLVAMVFVIALELLVRHYSFGYKKPLLYMLGGILVLSLLGTYLISQTRMHGHFQDRADRGELPVLGHLYRNFDRPPADVHIGIVAAAAEDGLVLATKRNEQLQVQITEHTRLPRGAGFAIGDRVVVVSEHTDATSTVVAHGIRPVPDDAVRLPMRPVDHMVSPKRDNVPFVK